MSSAAAVAIEKKSFHNEELGLSAFIVIDSVNSLPAIGGCRCLRYKNPEQALTEAINLSQAMTQKSAAHELKHGGAKMVVALPEKFDRNKVMQQIGLWVESMQGAYITANDSGTTLEDMELIAKTTKYVACKTRWQSYNPAYYTALGVYSSITETIGDLDGLKITLQGVGAVGMHLMAMLSQHKVNITISDIDNQKAKTTCEIFNAKITDIDKCLFQDCDLLIPCALGGILNAYSLPKIKAKYIIGAANNQFQNPNEDKLLAKSLGIVVAPDYIANGGGLVHVAGLYAGNSDQEIMQAVKKIGQRTKQAIGLA